MKNRTKIMNADPKPVNRDPVQELNEHEPSVYDPIPTYPEKTNDCPKCGYGVSRIYGTVDDIPRRHVRRYRKCRSSSCNHRWSTWRPMTEEEKQQAEKKEYENAG